eukprot:CAMPEP_0115560954 /NCGR_PEP_ID=MMETSP0271-20121206/100737_1 /TAXON_ID=71861 /ORGANISM="Scrippsiella trochoidea, Strain CCMP3099" /LENGTH=76 /DNA_ID=CAMNT_0002995051 /DNA_START=433 /DNA_END=663 /DNA_ORIENTATION=-
MTAVSAAGLCCECKGRINSKQQVDCRCDFYGARGETREHWNKRASAQRDRMCPGLMPAWRAPKEALKTMQHTLLAD